MKIQPECVDIVCQIMHQTIEIFTLQLIAVSYAYKKRYEIVWEKYFLNVETKNLNR